MKFTAQKSPQTSYLTKRFSGKREKAQKRFNKYHKRWKKTGILK